MKAGAVGASSRSLRRGSFAIGAAGAWLLAAALIAVAIVVHAGSVAFDGAGASAVQAAVPSALALRDIPSPYLRLYEAAGARYGLDWATLAGVGKVECDHGRDPDPSCTRAGVTNVAGAGGPMQFLASTWVSYGVDVDGAGRGDRWNAADAIYAAARYLRASGAPVDIGRALFAYNHASWYVSDVERWAARYRAPAQAVPESGAGTPGTESPNVSFTGRSPTPVLFVAGTRARLAAGDGHLALIPAGAPDAVQAMVVAGNELQALGYGPSGHPDPRGAREEDCSSSVNYVLYRSGIRPIDEILKDNPLAQDYVRWGAPGAGRWVSIYATTTPTDHVFIVIAGLRLDTSHAGTDEGPNRFEDGPRWRLLDHIPTWARWSVRHPAGL
ncbi:MAG TPA: lytic transglycosylase domain-containing protein [Solirubrobacteraceae bacterium]|jgi:hypothetical protein|nr:lytic transglycosylase domain-containing protein [Solirubrobacteraceae bacterium]